MSRPLDLLDLPNCVIVHLLSYLDATTLYLLSKTCTRFAELIKSHSSLWRFIDCRRAPNDRSKVSYCIARGHKDTHAFLVRANNQLETITREEFFPTLNAFENLRILALENQMIDARRYTVRNFPGKLHELSLKRSIVINATLFFRHSSDHMKHLRVLILDECNWLGSYALMPISKYENLEILSVYKCKNLDNCIPYLSLSGQYGFQKLKIFDARLSPLGNTLIRSLYRSKSLLAIYLQNEDLSYQLDYFKRKLEVLKGAPTREYYIEDTEFDLNDPLEENGLIFEHCSTLDDRGLLDYLSMDSTNCDPVKPLPKSFLYLDPYNTCTCGYEERQKQKKYKRKKKSPPSSSNGGDDDDDDHHRGGGGGDTFIDRLETKIARLARIIRRGEGASLRGTNGEGYRWIFDDEETDNFVMDLAEIDSFPRRFEILPVRNDDEVVDELSGGPSEENGGFRHAISINAVESEIRKRPLGVDDEPKVKKAKTEEAEPTAGPSGLNSVVSDESESSETEEDYSYMKRPPTPHPDNPLIEKNDEYKRIYLRNSPVVRIEHIANVDRDNQVPLRRLSLRGYNEITNTALTYIKDLNLEVLDLTYTKVSKEGINKYLESHPLCWIVHEDFCICPTNLHF